MERLSGRAFRFPDKVGSSNFLRQSSSSATGLLISLAVLGLFIALLRKIDDYDIWYHLAIGKEIIATGGIPTNEFLVYPLAGQPTHFFEWAFGVFYFLVWKYAGFWGMSFVNALIGSGTILFAFLAGRERLKDLTIPCATIGPLVLLMSFRFMYRPEMILFLSLSAGLYLLERYQHDPRPRSLLLLPALAFINGNFHPSSAMLVILCLSYFLQYFIHPPDTLRRVAVVRHFSPIVLLTAAAGAIGPYGLTQLIIPFLFVKEHDLFQTIDEFMPILDSPYSLRFTILTGAGLLALVAAKKKRIVDFLLFGFFAYLSLRHLRNFGLFALFAYLPLTTAIHDLGARVKWSASPTRKGLIRSGALVIFILSLGLLGFSGLWGSGPVAEMFPEKSAQMILEKKPRGRIFNSYHSGGYLSWRLAGAYQVFIDGRHYSFDKSLFEYQWMTSGVSNWSSIVGKYDINTMIVSTMYSDTGMIFPLTYNLLTDDQWDLMNIEGDDLLFFRNTAATARPGLGKQEGWLRIMRKAEDFIERHPSREGAYHSIITAGLNIQDYTRVAAYAQRYLKIHPGDRDVEKLLTMLQQRND